MYLHQNEIWGRLNKCGLIKGFKYRSSFEVVFVCQVKTQLYQPPELPGPGHLQVTVSALGEDGHIYMRTQNAGAANAKPFLQITRMSSPEFSL